MGPAKYVQQATKVTNVATAAGACPPSDFDRSVRACGRGHRARVLVGALSSERTTSFRKETCKVHRLIHELAASQRERGFPHG